MALGKRREFEVFTLSFLDCICCGFGAIILLLVLTDIGQPIVIERSEKDLRGQILDLQRQLFELRGETEVLNRELQGRMKVLTAEQQKAAALAGDLSKIRGEFNASKGESAVTNIVETELVAAHQTLTAEMQRLLKNAPRRDPNVLAVGGIPVDSEWIIFVIDTSGSMQADNWENAQNVMKEILDIYPKVKGMQILDDEGKAHVREHQGPVAAGHAGAARQDPVHHGQLEAVQRFEPGGRHRRRGAGLVGGGQEDQRVCHRRRFHRPVRGSGAAGGAQVQSRRPAGAPQDSHSRHRHARRAPVRRRVSISVFLF